ncbi:CU044_5270 family protein [Nonomuraea rhodomycinica]|uniref:CU044_5270 family protein n=1 Tax=Nonomuraea rhodomycinica TaxID=1712872 RepID=A0A7Y6M9L1_9ACTN|nr:CU044_5270 family protein [Nonomuraea rhodomycinica]NUW38716.1 CU044_5270 family protein [Nonomuraea rhodomycinica]
MNDIETLRECWERPAPPAADVRAAARAALLARAAGPPRGRRRWAVRALALAAATVVIATGATVVQTVAGGERSLPPANAQVVLTRIAAAVQEKNFTPPRDDQWIYTEIRRQGHFFKGMQPGARFTPSTPLRTDVDDIWTRADGRRIGYMVNGKLTTSDPGVRTPENTYALLTALPTDPDALLARFREIHGGGKPIDDAYLFERFAVTLEQSIVPPAQEAAIYRALAKVPGVTVDESATDAEGRPALSVSRVADGWREVEILLDPATYAYRQRRETAVADHDEMSPRPGVEAYTGEDGTSTPQPPRLEWSIEKGAVWNIFTRTAVGVVDQVGQKPRPD